MVKKRWQSLKLPARTVKAFQRARLPGYQKIRGKNAIRVEAAKAEAIAAVKGRGEWAVLIAKTRNLKNGSIRKIPLPLKRGTVKSFRNELARNPAFGHLLRSGEHFAFTFRGHQSYRTFRSVEELDAELEHYAPTSEISLVQLVRVSPKRIKQWQASGKGRVRRRARKEARRAMRTPKRKPYKPVKDTYRRSKHEKRQTRKKRGRKSKLRSARRLHRSRSKNRTRRSARRRS